MTDSPFQDAVVIDTNVFEHLLNPQSNCGEHINSLLTQLKEEGVALLLDKNSRIWGEYNNRISAIIKRTDDIGPEIYILRYWMRDAPRVHAAVDGSDRLMTIIKSVIIEHSETVDRILIYVALCKGKALITNDHTHIVSGPVKELGHTPRRDRLLRDSKKIRPKGGAILTSQEAHAKI